MKYYYNQKNCEDFYRLVNNGVRMVVYNVTAEHFNQLYFDDIHVLNIFLPQNSFVLPFLKSSECVYGDNLLVCCDKNKDYATLACLYECAISKVWEGVVSGEEVDLQIFKNLDALANCNCGFYVKLHERFEGLKRFASKIDCGTNESEVLLGVCLRVGAVLATLNDIDRQEEQYIDFYKQSMSAKEIDAAYNLISNVEIIELLRRYNSGLTKVCTAVLNRLKIIAKKYFNLSKIKYSKIADKIRMHAKSQNIDNLLYISYIFGNI